MASLAEVEAVDEFLRDEKTLYGNPPEFGPGRFVKNGRSEMTAVWPIADSLGLLSGGEIRIVSRPSDDESLSIAVVFARQCVSRVDFVTGDMCEANPPWAETLGLQPRVCGPHFHSWEHNRNYVLTNTWKLPAREALPPQVRRFKQAWPWLADRINLRLSSDQRQFEIPQTLI